MTLKLTYFDSDLMGEEVTHFADTDFEVDGIRYRPTPGVRRRLMFEQFPDDGHMGRAYVFRGRPVELAGAAAETDTVLFL